MYVFDRVTLLHLHDVVYEISIGTQRDRVCSHHAVFHAVIITYRNNNDTSKQR